MSDDVEDLVMKLFLTTLTNASRRLYDNIPNKNFKTMDQLEDTFLKIWSTKEDPNLLLTRLTEIKKSKNETVKEFDAKFENFLQ
jgi:hypothetical protein